VKTRPLPGVRAWDGVRLGGIRAARDRIAPSPSRDAGHAPGRSVDPRGTATRLAGVAGRTDVDVVAGEVGLGDAPADSRRRTRVVPSAVFPSLQEAPASSHGPSSGAHSVRSLAMWHRCTGCARTGPSQRAIASRPREAQTATCAGFHVGFPSWTASTIHSRRGKWGHGAQGVSEGFMEAMPEGRTRPRQRTPARDALKLDAAGAPP
jgi:hypothetical protein